MTLKELTEAAGALDELMRVSGLPMKTALEIVRLADSIETERRFFADELDRIAREYGTADETGAYVEAASLDGERRERFLREYEELCSIEVDTPAKKIIIPGSAKGLTPKSLMALREFVEVADR